MLKPREITNTQNLYFKDVAFMNTKFWIEKFILIGNLLSERIFFLPGTPIPNFNWKNLLLDHFINS